MNLISHRSMFNRTNYEDELRVHVFSCWMLRMMVLPGRAKSPHKDGLLDHKWVFRSGDCQKMQIACWVSAKHAASRLTRRAEVNSVRRFFCVGFFLLSAFVPSISIAMDERSTELSDTQSYLVLYSALKRGDHLVVGQQWGRHSIEKLQDEELLEGVFNSLCQIGDLRHALRIAPFLESSGPSGALAALLKSLHFVRNQEWASARSSIDEALKGPIATSAYVVSAWILAGSGMPDEAIDYLDRVATPEIAVLRDYTAALIAEKYGSRYEARRRWGEIAKSDFRHILLFESMAKFQWRSGEYDGAMRTIVAAREAFPLHAKINQLERLISQSRKSPEFVDDSSSLLAKSLLLISGSLAGSNAVLSIQLSNFALHLSRDTDVADFVIAEAAVNAKQYALARRQYDAVVPQSPMLETARVQSAFLEFFLTGPEAAEDRLAEMAKKNSNRVQALGALGDVLRARKKWADAIVAYSNAIAQFSGRSQGHAVWYFNRAISNDYAGNWMDARKDLEQALALAPNNPQVLNYLSYGLIERGEDLEYALELIQKAMRFVPEDAQFIDTLGWGYFRLGRIEEAERLIRIALEKMPGEPVITEHLADIHWHNGRTLEAIWLWRQALELKPEERDYTRISEKVSEREPR